ncbi:hypothetical protein DOZ91_01615 [Peribacillus frigoritolerans]|nr:hypothetical protein [Peribacillus frigoritolerans]AZV59437.1 hypothetical protein DOZ91_01615 [Peribacillus frigoritolerans]
MINGDVVRGSYFFLRRGFIRPQYDDRNFLQALENGSGTKEATIREEYEIDSISCLVGEKYGSEVQEKIK